MMRLVICLISIALVSMCEPLYALAPVDLSAIGDFRAFTQNIKDSPKRNNLNMQLEELELAIQGYLNPFAKGDVFVSSGGDNFEIEEASATILRGLPLDMNIKAGQYLVDFGKLNQGHPHAWSFMDRPIVHRMFFGPEGLRDQGIQLSTLVPIGVYSKLSVNVLSGRSIVGEDEDRNTQRPIYAGRYNVFLQVGEFGNIDAGVSGLTGTYRKETVDEGGANLKVGMAGIDFKYKYRPSDYTSLIFQTEWMINRRDLRRAGQITHINNKGGFAFIDCRFKKRYNAGAMIDYAPGIFDYQSDDLYDSGPSGYNNTPLGKFDDKNSTVAFTGFVGFALLEETTMVRLIGRYMKFNIDDPSLLANPTETSRKSTFLVGAQLLFAMGPHKPHDF